MARAKGTFFRRVNDLLAETPKESIKGVVKVDQVYAHYQHAHPEFRHPDGGKAFYLRDPLFHNVDDYLDRLGDSALDADEGLGDAMIENMEGLSREVFEQAPMEFGDLRASGHPSVEVDGQTVYDRPPNTARLTEEDLKAKHEVSRLFDPDRYK
ncbi:MAG: hypothetical protein ACRDQA_22890 [Nocardioidaceae bacterium]